MSRAGLADAATLVQEALELYADDRVAVAALERHARRLREPLRLAVAGMVKAGKSTVLNALIGEQIAPTDAGECTKIVTWYRYSVSARITAHLKSGGETRLPVKRTDGALVIELGALTADQVGWIEVAWPSESLRSLVIIDTPGIASLSQDVSARSHAFLAPDDAPSDADAILYLLRHIHASDIGFLEAFRDNAAGSSQTVNAVALLSRADEIGSGRIDSLLSAARVADRYRRDGELRALALGCIPVAGLLAEGARALRESEFAAFRELAGLDRATRDRMLVSVDRFTRPSTATTLSVEERKRLLARFGIFGVRLGSALVRAGASSSTDLAQRLVQQSGLLEVQQFIVEQFRARASVLKTRAVLAGLEDLLRDKPRDGSDDVRAGLERLVATNHELRELVLLSEFRTTIPRLASADAAEAERIIGGSGTAVAARLGLTDSARTDEVREALASSLAKWRTLSESPLSDRATVEICRVVIRSLEGIASQVGAAAPGADRSTADVVAAGSPA